MNKEFKNKLIGSLIVVVGLVIVLVPFSMLIGWNLLTAILFWLVLTPVLTIYLPTSIKGNKDQLFESLVGMTIFYAIMVFMIYDHYKTDLFQVMIVSFVVNMIVVSIWTMKKTHRSQIQ